MAFRSERRRKHIFPFQEEADVIFNSNLVYEMGVLKNAAMRELVKVPTTSPHYADARRLIGLLACFLPIEASDVPDDSILKEFIGNSFSIIIKININFFKLSLIYKNAYFFK